MINVLLDRFVQGRPAPFATAGERAWKEAIAVSLTTAEPDAHGAFLELDFDIAPGVVHPGGADLDNLCEPVFSVLVNRLGWFGRSRPNVRAVRARKTIAQPTGCRVRITDDRWEDQWIAGPPLLDGLYVDRLPTSARDEAFAAWVGRTMIRPAGLSGGLLVELRFAGPVNLGDIATGRLKNVIDCLYPVIGGRQGAPDDARITVLEATRMHPAVNSGLHIRVAELG